MTAPLPLQGGSGEKKWTLADGIAEIRRELALRKQVYPNFVARNRYTQDQVDGFVRNLEGALKFLEFCANNEARLKAVLQEAP
jgi:hypothetical protein